MDQILAIKILLLLFGVVLILAGIFRWYTVLGVLASKGILYWLLGINGLRADCILSGTIWIICAIVI